MEKGAVEGSFTERRRSGGQGPEEGGGVEKDQKKEVGGKENGRKQR